MSLPDSSPVRVVATDTNILINLIHVGRLDLLAKLHPYSFVVPEEVVQEVKDSRQAEAPRTAISSSILEVIQLADPAEPDDLCRARSDSRHWRGRMPKPRAVPALAHSF